MSDEEAPLVLVADDQEGQLVLIDMLLSVDGYRIALVRDGREALGWLSSNTPDLAILDIAMPFLDGIEICRRIKKITRLKEVPVVILTGIRDEGKLEAAHNAGADAMVLKPLEGKDFRGTIRELIDARRAGRDDADGTAPD